MKYIFGIRICATCSHECPFWRAPCSGDFLVSWEILFCSAGRIFSFFSLFSLFTPFFADFVLLVREIPVLCRGLIFCLVLYSSCLYHTVCVIVCVKYVATLPQALSCCSMLGLLIMEWWEHQTGLQILFKKGWRVDKDWKDKLITVLERCSQSESSSV